VIFQHRLSFESHVVSLLKQCSKRIYLLKMLRCQSIPPAKLHIIFRAIVVSRILYALPAWGTHLLSSQSGRTDAFFKRAYRCGLAGELFTVDHLLYSSGTELFKKCHPSNLRIMFCVTVASPHCNYQFHKNSFIITGVLESNYSSRIVFSYIFYPEPNTKWIG